MPKLHSGRFRASDSLIASLPKPLIYEVMFASKLEVAHSPACTPHMDSLCQHLFHRKHLEYEHKTAQLQGLSMCGITGYLSCAGNFNPEAFASANNLVTHRGPDDFGNVSFDWGLNATPHTDEWLGDLRNPENVVAMMGFRRLAIIDLSHAGHQPMPDADRRYWIVFNGEVYNYIEIRAELEAIGHRFRSASDTEVVLTAYKEWGKECQHKFNGMWAFSIIDTEKRELFCSRDRFGIKPFYFYSSDKQFIFASEIKQILQLVDQKPNVNRDSVFDFLAYGARNHTNATFYEDIAELRGGECMTVSLASRSSLTVEKTQWWDIKASTFDGSEQEAQEVFLGLLSDSVSLRLRSDVPTGTALSGGLDSNALVALIDQLSNNKRQNVFTVFSNDKNLDELVYAKNTIERFNAISHLSEFGSHDIELLEKITYHRDQPVDDAGALGGWLLQSLIKESGIVVNLSGHGADELMGGYSLPPHVNQYLDALSQGRLTHAHKELFYGFKNSSLSLLDTSVRFGRDVGQNICSDLCYKIMLNRHKLLMKSSFTSQYKDDSGLMKMLNEKHRSIASTRVKEISYRELKATHLPYILQNLDRDSMAHSLETRVPFLDYRLAEFLFSVPDSMLHKRGYTKLLLRKALTGKVSNEIVWNKKKTGFSTPKNRYLSKGENYFNDLLAQDKNHSILNIDNIKRTLKSPKAKLNKILWRSLCYLIWERQQSQL